MQLPVLFVLFFLSGAAALVYEILWLAELGRLFGVTAHATATTLAVFFLGLSAGSMAWGRHAVRTFRPLRTYALLELGIAVSALLYFALVAFYRQIYGGLFGAFGSTPALFLLVKFLLAAILLFPPAFFMGGTLPVMAQHVIRRSEELGRTATLLYAVNTVGAAVGAWAAGFILPATLGYRMSYGVAIGINVTIAALAWTLSSRSGPETDGEEDARDRIGAERDTGGISAGLTKHPTGKTVTRAASHQPWDRRPGIDVISTLAFASGLLTLALEVLWTRMFAQVLQNSVYTFAGILTVFLIALAAGSSLAHGLCRKSTHPERTLGILLLLSGIGAGAVPFLFVRITHGLVPIGEGLGWTRYVLAVYGTTGLVLFVPGLIVGTVFPYLLKVVETKMSASARDPRLVEGNEKVQPVEIGSTIGRLASLNTLGAILGSLAAGFLLLEWLGLWRSLWAVSGIYFGLALVHIVSAMRPDGHRRHRTGSSHPANRAALSGSGSGDRAAGGGTSRWILGTVGIAGVVLALGCMSFAQLPVIRLDASQNEKLLGSWEGNHGIVAVTDRDGSLSIKVDNSYLLGTSGAAVNERMQAWIPLALHPRPQRVFFLGMGTGITAGGALDFPVETVTVAELNPDVIEAARTLLAPYLNGLFTDDRVRVIYEDGRNYLSGTSDRYDVVVSDIFLSYRAGVGSLYTKEHFEAIRDRLEPGGVFAQWLPLFDISPDEMGILCRTMLEVFPQVTLWRRGFSPKYPIFALIGQRDVGTLPDPGFRDAWTRLVDQSDLPANTWIARIPFAAYVSDLSARRDRYTAFQLSTDDRTPLEYTAPITERNSKGSQTARVLAWSDLGSWLEDIATSLPPSRDPYLARLAPPEVGQVLAGLSYYQYSTYERMGDAAEAERWWRAYQEQIPSDADGDPSRETIPARTGED
ncbi:MAG: fused MFS/spermidine synthase [Candidatus Eisenbacteria bacterium]|uniref:Fused MFS/spermidine synthase n=1 Tax=Eiseniibacteriota bacterium TaxID=2212470 RepID=A0A956RNA1_UNCEI|nr:fused MFS/spermidine synthase [Candidatus Eisenbacteria bacterium]